MTEETKIILDEIRGLKDEMVGMKNAFYSLEGKVGSLEGKVDSLDNRVGSLEEKMGSLDREVKEIRLTQENEVIHAINIVAEGHADLNRKLDKALQATNEKEIMLLRLNALENEVRRIKDKIATIA